MLQPRTPRWPRSRRTSGNGNRNAFCGGAMRPSRIHCHTDDFPGTNSGTNGSPALHPATALGQCAMIRNELPVRNTIAVQEYEIISRGRSDGLVQNGRFEKAVIRMPEMNNPRWSRLTPSFDQRAGTTTAPGPARGADASLLSASAGALMRRDCRLVLEKLKAVIGTYCRSG